MNDTSSIFISNLKTLVRVGCSVEERETPQLIAFDVEIATDLRPAAESEKIEDTICYATVAEQIVHLAQSRDWILLETLGEQIVTLVFEKYSEADSISLDIRKFVVNSTDAVGIKLQRKRP